MIAKLTALAAVWLTLVSNTSLPSPYGASFATVPQLTCLGEKGGGRGSGVRIAGDLIITASHVNSHRTCITDDGVKLSNTRFEPGQDVSFLQGDLPQGWRAIISCDGITEGNRYLAMGYPDDGRPNAETLIGTNDTQGALTLMRGHVFPGMSGGAVLNEHGALVAIINARETSGKPIAFVTPLTQTYLCKGGTNA